MLANIDAQDENTLIAWAEDDVDPARVTEILRAGEAKFPGSRVEEAKLTLWGGRKRVIGKLKFHMPDGDSVRDAFSYLSAMSSAASVKAGTPRS